jgi:hypothetical protein
MSTTLQRSDRREPRGEGAAGEVVGAEYAMDVPFTRMNGTGVERDGCRDPERICLPALA